MKASRAVPAVLVSVASAFYLGEHSYALARYLRNSYYRRKMEVIKRGINEQAMQADIQADLWWATEGESVVKDYIDAEGLVGEEAATCLRVAQYELQHFAIDRMTAKLQEDSERIIRRLAPKHNKERIDDAITHLRDHMDEHRMGLESLGYDVAVLEKIFQP